MPNIVKVVIADNVVNSGRKCGINDFAVEDWEKIEDCTFINSTGTIEMNIYHSLHTDTMKTHIYHSLHTDTMEIHIYHSLHTGTMKNHTHHSLHTDTMKIYLKLNEAMEMNKRRYGIRCKKHKVKKFILASLTFLYTCVALLVCCAFRG